ncbi:putative mitochondrial import inner membrane translocase subunit TIM9 [Cardiosporidium cionae]|uniref:Mitochondrial import inner membrane translocase subunit n=1 Tax=Cardiosporidium cionae TaxID=476202 RepID=A0ABQ7JEH4_9APIC|nr:putative mitochondrial import inner membrane translocase subunit TIM9 [Cardiosporidium cionae]|eukprot:KAF8822411.1 putative mitochondrial import inner membrane translocase subunit TIM9 [Cardiosporidium cionae]
MANLLELDNMTAVQKERILLKLADLQIEDSMNTYNGLVERCFSECISHFRGKNLDDSEKSCIDKCVEKYLNFSQRVGLRFAERNVQS